MFEGQNVDAVMATALNHASTAMLFALERMDEYTAFVHAKQTAGTISAGDFNGPMYDIKPIEPNILRHDLAVAAALIHALAHRAQDDADDVRVAAEADGLDAELADLFGLTDS